MKFLPIVSLFGISFVFSAYSQNTRDLLNAADTGNIENVRNLVEVVGVPANILDGEALIEAAENGRLEVVRYLVGEGPEDTRVLANIRNGEALIHAARNGHLDTVRFLVEEGPEDTRVPANIQNGEALIIAAKHGRLEIVRYLLESYLFDFDGDQCDQAINACNSSKYMNREIKIEIHALIEANKAAIEFSPK